MDRTQATLDGYHMEQRKGERRAHPTPTRDDAACPIAPSTRKETHTHLTPTEQHESRELWVSIMDR